MSASPLLPTEEQGDEARLRRVFAAQRLGWVIMALVVVAGVVGVFGTGPVSWSTADASDSSMTVSFQRFARRGGTADLTLTMPVSATDRQAEVWLDGEYLRSLKIEHITPEPASQRVDGGGDVILTFDVGEGASSLKVTISAKADQWGVQDGRAGRVGAAAVEFWQLFYP